MLLLIIVALLMLSIYLVLYQLELAYLEKPHLSTKVFTDNLELNLQNTVFANKPTMTLSHITQRFRPYEESIPLSKYLKRRLIRAGSPMGILEFLIFKVLSLILLPMLAFILLGNAFPKNMVLSVSLAIGFLLPEIWLNNKIKKRQHNIRKELPMVIDLLNLCVSGGLDFMLAVNRVVKDLRPTALTRELGEVYRQTQMGKTRVEALKNFAWRLDTPEIYSFVRTLVQADRMGSPIAEALKIQSEEIKVKRFQRGEAMALKAPIKLLFPLFAFILPVVLIIVGGPIILQFMNNKGNLGF